MAKKKKLTPNQQEWRKQTKRINDLIRRLEKRGYIVDKSTLIKIPKTITKKALERIKGIKTAEIIKKSKFKLPETGEIIRGEEGKKYENIRRSQKAAKTRKEKQRVKEAPTEPPTAENTMPRQAFYNMVIENYFANLPGQSGTITYKVYEIVNSLIDQYGIEQIATVMLKASEQGLILTREIWYSDELRAEYFRQFISILPISKEEMERLYDDILEYADENDVMDYENFS